jgi:carboxyl-terminal processing protease
MSFRPTVLSMTLAAVCAGSFAMLVVPAGLMLWRHATEALPDEGLRTLRLVHQQILAEHVEAQDPDQLLTKAVQGMVKDLDRYSEFVPASAVEGFEARELDGTYVGIGVLLFGGHAPITVQAPLAGGPAEAAGIEVGDRILAVDGEDVSGIAEADALATAIRLLRGPVGSEVELRVEGEGPARTVRLRRGAVAEPRVKWVHLLDPEAGLGYVHVSGFQREVTAAFDAAVEALRAEAGGELRGLVLDLRHDPGGLLEEAIALANRFVGAGEIVALKRRGEVVVERHLADPARCSLPDLPLVVLIDRGTASASEVVTGALQDHGRARVVGVRSYGKGVVQSIYTWRGLDFRLKLTTSHYYTPSGRSIEGRLRREGDGEAEGGIEPDLAVPVEREVELRIVERLRANEVPPVHRERARAVAATIGREVTMPLTPGEDPQLAAALAELRRLAEQRRLAQEAGR